MNISPSIDIRRIALDCVSDMGDIFWDYDSVRDGRGQYRDPYDVAAEAIERVLRDFVAGIVRTEDTKAS